MPDSRTELIQYRLDAAEEKWSAAQVLLEAGNYKDSVGRSYYAMFSAVRALLAKDNVDFAKHSGVIVYFQREYIKTDRIEKKYSKYLSEAFQIRNNCDYADFYLIQKEDAAEQCQRAKEFIVAIREFLDMAL